MTEREYVDYVRDMLDAVDKASRSVGGMDYDAFAAGSAARPLLAFTPTGSMSARRNHHSAVLLPTGKVLVVGGRDAEAGQDGAYLASAGLYDPATSKWTSTGSVTAKGRTVKGRDDLSAAVSYASASS